MAKRDREWAKRVRRDLVERLGGKCARCGRRPRSLKALELDHVKPASPPWVPRSLAPEQRVREYLKQFAVGNLQVLCKNCNSLKGCNELEPVGGWAVTG